MDPGLCADCRHVKVLRNERGNRFYLCTLAEKDPRFPRYPRLPVKQCAGYAALPPPELRQPVPPS